MVEVTGTGSGTVTGGSAEQPNAINCTSVGDPGGSGSGRCDASFPPEGFGAAKVFLTASPDAGSFFAGWSGDAFEDAEFGFDATCNSGASNPCHYFSTEAFGPPFGPTTIVATFDLLPGPPVAATGTAVPGQEEWLRTLRGTVDPREFAVSECFFEYGTTTAYGTKTPCVEPGASELDAAASAGSEPVHASTEPLEYETTYHFRLVAVNLGGVHRGEDRTFTTGPVPTGVCPNELRRREQGIKSLVLPDCMALEMVSPPLKGGKVAYFPNVSVDGQRVSFVSAGALGANPPPALTASGSLYVAGRGTVGWSTERTLPEAGLDALWAPANAFHKPTASLTPDFSRSLGIGASNLQRWQGIGQAFSAGLGGGFRWLSAPLVPRISDSNGTDKGGIILGTTFQAASADHSHFYFRPGKGGTRTTTYLAHDPLLFGPGIGREEDNTYLVRTADDGDPAAEPELLQEDRDGAVWGQECGARLGGIGAAVARSNPTPNGDRNQGAVSADGRRTYLSARVSQPAGQPCDPRAHKLRILKRLEEASGVQISPLFSSECSRPATPNPPGLCKELSGDDLYQGASLDQSKVYFTTNRQLADTDGDGTDAECDLHLDVTGCDLYLYDSDRRFGERLVQVSAGETVGGHIRGNEASVYNGITAISADGSRAYFVATGVLTDDENSEGQSAREGEPNLYVFDLRAWEAAGGKGGLSFIGQLVPSDQIEFSGLYALGLWGGQGTWRNNAYPVPVLSAAERRGEGEGEEGGDGHILVFLSHAALTANDADGGHLDVYRYGSEADMLQCVSCRPGSSAARPDEQPIDVQDRGEGAPLGTDFAELQRWVSEDGREVVFATAEGLLPGDVNGVGDIYLWRDGELYRLPAQGAATDATSVNRPVLAPDGATVAFATADSLLPEDGDPAGDVYVARVGGGFPSSVAPNPCQPGSDCQQPQATPAAPSSASAGFTQGNLKPRRCAGPARKAHSLSKRAKRLRARAASAARHDGNRAKAMRRKAGRLAGRAHRLSDRARRCRAKGVEGVSSKTRSHRAHHGRHDRGHRKESAR